MELTITMNNRHLNINCHLKKFINVILGHGKYVVNDSIIICNYTFPRIQLIDLIVVGQYTENKLLSVDNVHAHFP